MSLEKDWGKHGLHMSPQLNATFKLFKERCRHDVLIEASWTFKNDSCPFDFSLWLKKWGYRNFGGFSGWNSVEKVPLKMAWWLQVRNPRLHGSGWAMLACGPPGGASDFFKPTGTMTRNCTTYGDFGDCLPLSCPHDHHCRYFSLPFFWIGD